MNFLRLPHRIINLDQVTEIRWNGYIRETGVISFLSRQKLELNKTVSIKFLGKSGRIIAEIVNQDEIRIVADFLTEQLVAINDQF